MFPSFFCVSEMKYSSNRGELLAKKLSGKEAVLIGETYSSPVGVLTFPLVFLVPEEILVLLFLLLRGLG